MTEEAGVFLELRRTGECFIGQLRISKLGDGGFAITHRDDRLRGDLELFEGAEAASELSRFDDDRKYRPLKTAPNLRHGWELRAGDENSLHGVVEQFYPGRLSVLAAWNTGNLAITPFRETLARQSGMYRVSAKITDDQADTLVGNFCRSDGGCLRTILWKRDSSGTLPSSLLPMGKYDASVDQTGNGSRAVPLLCQEACNLLIAEAREVVKQSALA